MHDEIVKQIQPTTDKTVISQFDDAKSITMSHTQKVWLS